MQTKRKRILLISYFFDQQDASALCIEHVMNYLVKHEYAVDVICARTPASSSEYSSDDAINVHRIPSLLLDFRAKTEKETARNRLQKEAGKVYRLLASLFSLEFKDFISRKTFRFAEQIIKKNDIAYVLSVSLPFQNHELAYRVKAKYPLLCWIMYQFDPFSYNYLYKESGVEDRLRHEYSCCKLADKIILTDRVWDSRMRAKFGEEIWRKTVTLPLPNLLIDSETDEQVRGGFDINKINLVFTGGIYSNIRKPEPLLTILSKLDDSRFTLHVFGYGLDGAEKQYSLAPGQLVFHGRVPKKELSTVLNSASALINFGNIMENQTPSKVFDYIATGRPIINFCYTENDTSLHYLERYPLFLNILNKDAGNEESVQTFRRFCLQYKDTSVSLDVLASLYNDLLSGNVCSRIMQHIEQ